MLPFEGNFRSCSSHYSWRIQDTSVFTAARETCWSVESIATCPPWYWPMMYDKALNIIIITITRCWSLPSCCLHPFHIRWRALLDVNVGFPPDLHFFALIFSMNETNYKISNTSARYLPVVYAQNDTIWRSVSYKCICFTMSMLIC